MSSALQVAASVGAALVTATATVTTVIIGRRQPRAVRSRADFEALTDELHDTIAEKRADIAELRAENAEQRQRIKAKQAVIRYLLRWLDRLTGYIRAQGLEPPPPPEPVPEIARPYLQDLVP